MLVFHWRDIDDGSFEAPTDQPIVFTAGTAHHHSRPFFENAVDTCCQLDRAGILLSTHQENFPEQLPPNVRACSYVSLRKLLPYCAAIVHHGGIGTTSQALAAGIPQIIRPMAFDQFDNATRVEKLGCGVWLKHARRMTETLAKVIRCESTAVACKDAKARLADPRAAAIAADQIESLF